MAQPVTLLTACRASSPRWALIPAGFGHLPRAAVVSPQHVAGQAPLTQRHALIACDPAVPLPSLLQFMWQTSTGQVSQASPHTLSVSWHDRLIQACCKPCFMQEMANLLWSYATLEHHPCDQLLEAMALHMVDRIAAYRPQAVSNSLWAYAKVRATVALGLHQFATPTRSGLVYTSPHAALSVAAHRACHDYPWCPTTAELFR